MKKVIIIIFVIILLLTLGVTAIIVFDKYRINQIKLITDIVDIEYGEKYDIKVENLIDLSLYSYINPENIEVKFDFENEEEKEYIAVGEYVITIKYKGRELNQKLIIQDTTLPELTFSQESIEIMAGDILSEDNIRPLLTSYDLSELKEYNIDFSNVDTNIAGEYFVKVSIEDIHYNKIEKEFKIVVKEAPKKTATSQSTSKSSNNTSNLTNSSTNTEILSCNHSPGVWFSSMEDANAYWDRTYGVMYEQQFQNGEIDFGAYFQKKAGRGRYILCVACGKHGVDK